MYEHYPLNLSLEESQIKVVIPILLSLFCFILYWFVAKSSKIKNFYYRQSKKASVKHIFFTKYFGFISMGLIPILFLSIFTSNFSFKSYGLVFLSETSSFSLIWIIGLSIVTIPIVTISARKSKNLVNYPQIRELKWNRKILFLNLFGWAIYLFGYELLFRGVLLFPLFEELGLWPAIAINVALYSATHIPKGLDETIGAIPLGFVLCILTLQSGTIWIAFIVHVVMAWTNSLTALKHHPDINYVKNET